MSIPVKICIRQKIQESNAATHSVTMQKTSINKLYQQIISHMRTFDITLSQFEGFDITLSLWGCVKLSRQSRVRRYRIQS